MKRLRRAVRRRSPSRPESVIQLSVPKDQLTALATDLGVPPRKSGVLLKYTNVLKRWKPRHFTLDNGLLLYASISTDSDGKDDDDSPSPPDSATERERKPRFKSRKLRLLRRIHSKDDREPDIKGSINIQSAVISADDSDPCRFAIDVGHDVFHCKAESCQIRDEWVAELNNSIQYFCGIIERAVARATESSNHTPSNQKHNLSNQSPPNASSQSPNTDSSGTPETTQPTQSTQPTQPTQPTPQSTQNHTLHSAQTEITTVSPQSTPNPSLGVSNNVLQSDDSDESTLEDDGLKDAERGRALLIDELGRIVTLWRQQWMETSSALDDERNLLITLSSTFATNQQSDSTEKPTPAGTAKGLVDVLSWCLHVLQTNDEMYERRLKADTARNRSDRLPVFPPLSPTNNPNILSPADPSTIAPLSPFEDDSDNESDFVDALSRAASKRSSMGRQITTPLCHIPASPTDDSILEDVQQIDHALTQPVNIRRISTAVLTSICPTPRTHLPPLTDSRERLNIFGILKDAVGKDLSKITLPVGLNEPISFVQRLAEDIEYCELLDKAAMEADANRRLMYVAAMVISHYSSTQGRVGKPFNPLLGETACLMRPEKGNGVRFISEQVSHHPPISACYAEGSAESWKYYNAIEVKNKFWGKSLEVFPTGLNHIEIPKFGDHYVLEQVTACVHNIVVGRMWLDNYGDMQIVNRTNGGRCVIEFSKTGWMTDAKSFAAIRGTIFDAEGKAVIKLGGNWTTSVYEDLGRGKKNVIWSVDERPPEGASQLYNMTKWAIALNEEVRDEERNLIPPSDSRMRPDQRALEMGYLDLGSRLKQALEDGQRKRRREMEEGEQPWEPLWFEKVTDELTGQDDYRFKGTFFKQQAQEQETGGAWKMCPDLFSSADGITE